MGFFARHTTLSVALAGVARRCRSRAARHASATDRAQSLVRQHREEEAVALLRMDLGDTRTTSGAAPSGAPARLHRRHGRRAHRDRASSPAAAVRRSDAVHRAGARAGARPPVRRGARGLRRGGERSPQSPAGPREGGMRSARWGEVDAAKPRLEEAVRRGRKRRRDVARARPRCGCTWATADGAEQAYRAGTAADRRRRRAGWARDGGGGAGRRRGCAGRVRRLLVLRPHFAAGELGRAWALAKLGRKDEAARALDHAEELGCPVGAARAPAGRAGRSGIGRFARPHPAIPRRSGGKVTADTFGR